MSVQLTQPENQTKETLELNKQTSGITGKQILEASSVNKARASIGSDHKNLIINGNFDIWQRSTTQTLNGLGSADRWYSGNLTSTKTITRETFTTGQTDVPNATYFYRSTVITGNTTSSFVTEAQRSENVARFAGKTFTISFWCKADGNKLIAFEGIKNHGIGGSSAELGIGQKVFEVTSEWQYITHTFYVPDSVGLTTNVGNYFQSSLWLDGGTNYVTRNDNMVSQSGTFDFAQFQLEEGDKATKFKYRPIGEELELCQRYYQKSYDLDVVPGTINSNGQICERATRNNTVATTGRSYQTRMRANPTVVIYSPQTGATGMIDNGGDKAAVATAGGEAKIGYVSITAGLIASQTRYHFTADAEL